VVKLPGGLSLKESMVYGTAGFTAALSILKLEERGVTPESGEILVTGATGGVGSIAVAILAKAGYQVVAATGKLNEKQFLIDLGVKEVIGRDEARDTTGRLLLKGRWSGVVDTVGGDILATAIKSTNYGGTVTCCGNVASHELNTNVYPFVLRGVSLVGIDSANCPMNVRLQVWEKMSKEWKLEHLDYLTSEIALEVIEGDTKTEHTVEVKNDYYQALTDGKIKPELLVEKSFTFLLDREPKESILGGFNLELISHYFPEYEEKIHDYY